MLQRLWCRRGYGVASDYLFRLALDAHINLVAVAVAVAVKQLNDASKEA